jgi:tetratricopeptide (TPR) repeat protein
MIMKPLSVSYQTTTDIKHGQALFTLLVFIGLLTITGSTLGDSPEENTRGMKLAEGDLSVATNEIERFYALGNAARNALKEGKVKEAKALAKELARVTPKYRDNWNYGNAVANANQILGQIALSKGDLEEAKKHLLASANSKGSPQLNSFGPNFKLAGKVAEKGEYRTVLQFLAQVKMFWANPNDRREANSKHVAGMHLQQLDSWRKQLQAGKVPDHPRWR